MNHFYAFSFTFCIWFISFHVIVLVFTMSPQYINNNISLGQITSQNTCVYSHKGSEIQHNQSNAFELNQFTNTNGKITQHMG